MSQTTLTRTQIYIPKEVLSKAKARAKISKTTVSKIIRDALQEFLKNEQVIIKPKINVIKLRNRKIQNYSEKIDQIYDY